MALVFVNTRGAAIVANSAKALAFVDMIIYAESVLSASRIGF
jgi:hypothetical protein